MQRNACAAFALVFALSACTKRMEVQTPEGKFEVEYKVRDGLRIAEDDIVLGPDHDGLIPNGPGLVGNGNVSAKWPNATMPYQIDPDLPRKERVTKAIETWQKHTRAKLVPRTDERDFVYFTKRNGCYSNIGRVGGRQLISLDDGCSAGNAIHEIGHAFGFWHEQARPDRDQFVTIHLNNVKSDMRGNFSMVKGEFVRLASPYDFDSIMHYAGNAFCVDCSKPTITRKDGKPISGQRSYLSANDVAGFEKMYGPKVAPLPVVTPAPTTVPVAKPTEAASALAVKTVVKGTYTPPSGREHVRFGVALEGNTDDVESVSFEVKDGIPKLDNFVAPFDIGTWAQAGWQAGTLRAKLKNGKTVEYPILVPERN